MERPMERPALGLPLGAATQSTGRPMGENGMGVGRSNPLSTVKRIPQNPNNIGRPDASAFQSFPSSAMPPITTSQVIALARDEMKKAVEENQTKAAEANGISTGVTVDLSHKQILRFPEEVVDIIKHELERYCLSCPTECHPKQLTPPFLGLRCHTTRFSRFLRGSRSAPHCDT